MLTIYFLMYRVLAVKSLCGSLFKDVVIYGKYTSKSGKYIRPVQFIYSYMMTTDIPASITTPDVVETSLGTVRFFDGFPDSATNQKVYDNLDFQRGVQAFLTELPSAYASKQSCEGFLVGDCLRSTDPIAATDGPAVPRFQQPENGPYLQSSLSRSFNFQVLSIRSSSGP